MDEDGYPENLELEYIKNYDVLNLPIKPLIKYIRSICFKEI